MEKTQYQAKLDFLNSYCWWKQEAKILSERVDDLEDQIASLRAQRITDMPRGGKAVGFDDLIAKKLDMRDKYLEDLHRAEDALKMIYDCIRSVDNIRDRTILSMVYVDGMSYKRIGEVLNYCSKQIQRYHKDAVENMPIPQRCPTMSQCVPGTM